MASDRIFFNNFMMVLGGLVLFTVIILVLAAILGGPTDRAELANDPQAQALLADRIAPIGDVAIAGLNTMIFDDANRALDTPPARAPVAPAPAPTAEPATVVAAATTSKSGKEVYDSVCFACHTTAVAGAPKFGDPDVWAPRIAKGIETLHANSINGYTGEAGVMPAKGGRVDLSDDEVKAAVQYMVDNAQ